LRLPPLPSPQAFPERFRFGRGCSPSEGTWTARLSSSISAKAERIVALGEEHIRKQKKLLMELERDNHPTETARELLRNYERMQVTHVEHRDIIKRELAAVQSGSL
jgi:hypothetical protein